MHLPQTLHFPAMFLQFTPISQQCLENIHCVDKLYMEDLPLLLIPIQATEKNVVGLSVKFIFRLSYRLGSFCLSLSARFILSCCLLKSSFLKDFPFALYFWAKVQGRGGVSEIPRGLLKCKLLCTDQCVIYIFSGWCLPLSPSADDLIFQVLESESQPQFPIF